MFRWVCSIFYTNIYVFIYSTKKASALKKHYNRKNPCKDKLRCGKLPKELQDEDENNQEVRNIDVPKEVGIIAHGLKLYCLIKNTTTQDTKNVYINMDITIYNHGKEIVDNDRLRKLFIKNIFETNGIYIYEESNKPKIDQNST